MLQTSLNGEMFSADPVGSVTTCSPNDHMSVQRDASVQPTMKLRRKSKNIIHKPGISASAVCCDEDTSTYDSCSQTQVLRCFSAKKGAVDS